MNHSYMTCEYDYLFKIILIGDSGVGKSALLTRYCDDNFLDTYISTIGVDFKIKTMEIDGKIIKLQMWDTAGQERFKSIVSSYYRGAQGVLICFNVEDVKSFENIQQWMYEIREYCQSDVILLLVGTKSDRRDDEKKIYNGPKELVKLEVIETFCKDEDIEYIETSAKINKNCEEVFELLSRKIRDQQSTIQTPMRRQNPFKQLNDKKKKSYCC